MVDTCTVCGSTSHLGSYSGPEGDRMRITGECFMCAFWELKTRNFHTIPGAIVINGQLYYIGREPRPDYLYRSDLGMGGRRFDIELIDSGVRFTTHNLWAGGEIPDRFRDRLPDTARFLNDAGAHEVNGTGCWNPSSSRTSPYPPYPGRTL